MSAIAFRLLRRARATWASTLGLALLVAVAGAAVLSIAAGARRTASAPDRFEAAHPAGTDVIVVQFDGLPRTDEVASLPAVVRADGATFMMAGVEPAAVDTLAFAGSIRGIDGTLVAGREPERSDEFVATDTFVQGVGAEIGSTFQFASLDQQQADEFGFQVSEPHGPTFEATLVGIATGYGDGDPSKPMDALVVFPATLVHEQPIPVRSSVIAVVLRDGATIDELRQQLATLPEPEQFTADPVVMVSEDVRTAVRTQATSLWLLGAVAAAATLAALGQIATRRARLSEAERASLSALGVSEPQLLVESIAHGAAPTIAGALLAGLLAPLFSAVFPTGFARRIDPTEGVRIDLLVVATGALALAVAFVAWIAVSLTSRHPRAAVGRRVGRRVGLASRVASSLPTPAVATGVRFAFTRSRSDRSIALGSLVGVVVATAGVIGALTFGASLHRLVDEPDRFGDPFTARFGDAGSTIPSTELQEALVQRSDVRSVALITSGQALLDGVGVGVVAIERVRGPLALHAIEGRLPTAPDEVALGRSTARAVHRGVGDEVELSGAGGAQIYRVTAIAPIPGIGGTEGIGHGSLLTLDGLRRLDPETQGVGVGIVMQPGWTSATVQQLADDLGLEQQFTEPQLPTPIANLDRVSGVPAVLAGVLSLLGALTVAHALLVSARNRRKDVAVLGALGADGRWLTTMVHWQALAFTSVPVLIGIPVGIVVGQAVFRVLADHVGVVPDATTPLLGVVVVLVGAMVLANVAALAPARRARRLDAAALLQAQ